MKKPFKDGYRITQLFGKNPSYYKPYGFNGHEGLDLVSLTSNWDIHSLESGKVVRDVDVPRDNYGKYVVVWNREKRRAFWYCHLKENVVKVGDMVSAGQKLGIMGSTGKVTGAHLHLGLRMSDANGNAINTGNGYKGFIDPLPILKELNKEEPKTMSNNLQDCLKREGEHLEIHADLMKQLEEKGKEVEQLQKRLTTSEETRKNLGEQVELFIKEIAEIKSTEGSCQKELKIANDSMKNLLEEREILLKDKNDFKKWYNNALANDISKKTVKELFGEILKKWLKR